MKIIKVLGTGYANCKTTLKLIEDAGSGSRWQGRPFGRNPEPSQGRWLVDVKACTQFLFSRNFNTKIWVF